MNQGGSYSTALRTMGFIGLALIALSILSSLLSGGRMGYGYNMNMYYGRGVGLDLGGVLASVLVLLIKVLWLVLIVSLIVGLFVYFKKNRFDYKKIDLVDRLFKTGYACPGCGTGLAEDYKFCPKCRTHLKDKCVQCGKEIQVGWKCCPLCGSETKITG